MRRVEERQRDQRLFALGARRPSTWLGTALRLLKGRQAEAVVEAIDGARARSRGTVEPELPGDVDQPRGVLGSLEIAADPVQRIGDS